MSVSVLAWGKATLRQSQPTIAKAAAANLTVPTSRLSASFATASAAKQHKIVPNRLVWRQADIGRRSFASQAASPSHSAVKSYLGSVLFSSAAGAGAVALYLGNTAGQPRVLFAQHNLNLSKD